MDLTKLTGSGIDWEQGVNRFLNDSEFYAKVLGMFLDDRSLEKAQAALAARDYRTVFACAHELKGSCGNTDMTELYQASCALVELLRHGDDCDEQELARLFAQFSESYLRARAAIEQALA